MIDIMRSNPGFTYLDFEENIDALELPNMIDIIIKRNKREERAMKK